MCANVIDMSVFPSIAHYLAQSLALAGHPLNIYCMTENEYVCAEENFFNQLKSTDVICMYLQTENAPQTGIFMSFKKQVFQLFAYCVQPNNGNITATCLLLKIIMKNKCRMEQGIDSFSLLSSGAMEKDRRWQKLKIKTTQRLRKLGHQCCIRSGMQKEECVPFCFDCHKAGCGQVRKMASQIGSGICSKIMTHERITKNLQCKQSEKAQLKVLTVQNQSHGMIKVMTKRL